MLVTRIVVCSMPFLLVACGGDIRSDELQRGVQSLGSLAAEGALVADDAARDRTKRTFARVQARTLGEEADHKAERSRTRAPRRRSSTRRRRPSSSRRT